ncbi:MAG TPA: flavodoxin family protein [Firmicutes bacterium]|nr:flavodoxin family protein [Bacillota bacterium]
MGETIKILGISGSPRRNGNTFILMQEALEGAQLVEGVETELVDLSRLTINPCTACRSCRNRHVRQCVMHPDDDMSALYPKIMEADGLILGSPVFFGGVTAQLKAFMDRTTCLGGDAGFALKYKVGAGITVGGTRHGGQEYTLSQIHHYIMMHGGVVVGGIPTHAYWGGAAVAGGKGEARKDVWPIKGVDYDALSVCRGVGLRVAVTAKLIKAGAQAAGADLLTRDLGGKYAWIPTTEE